MDTFVYDGPDGPQTTASKEEAAALLLEQGVQLADSLIDELQKAHAAAINREVLIAKLRQSNHWLLRVGIALAALAAVEGCWLAFTVLR
jgi:hypothetical protein